jgi:hypothetical protein
MKMVHCFLGIGVLALLAIASAPIAQASTIAWGDNWYSGSRFGWTCSASVDLNSIKEPTLVVSNGSQTVSLLAAANPSKPKSGPIVTVCLPPNWSYDSIDGTDNPDPDQLVSKRMYLASTDPVVNPVPEPGTWALLMTGAVVGMGVRWLRRRKQCA